MRRSRQQVGAAGEATAAAELGRQGLRLLDRNHRTREGEIDLIAQDDDCLVFVEARARRSARMGTPEESITPRKQSQLIALAEGYVAAHGWSGPWRIDVVAVQMDAAGRVQAVRWIPNAVEGR